MATGAKKTDNAGAALTVAVLMGGPSSEREISFKSGENVARAIEGLGHNVRRLDVNPDDLSVLVSISPDIAFVALHGAFGEDGTIQRRMEEMHLVYTGSGPEASCMAMDKRLSKARFAEVGLYTPEFRTARRGDVDSVSRAYGQLGPRVVVKPPAEGSSIGVSMPASEADCLAEVEALWASHDSVLIERYIEGRELTVGILADKALPAIELKPLEGFYDYESKYLSHETKYLTDIDLPAKLYAEVQDVGERAHAALGCRDFSRVDIILSSDDTPYVLEVNTIPGFTARSLLPLAAKVAGMDFAELCQRIVDLALTRSGAAADCSVDARGRQTGRKMGD
ncbi:MAG: D-alanine--D-alanine ligase [Phycisphaerae bacterium]|jgi:D-alanine-D-alanine ligase|nr:D-alanine--D-alanine ligase [Phycisphaerae bacterium]